MSWPTGFVRPMCIRRFCRTVTFTNRPASFVFPPQLMPTAPSM